MASVAVMEAGRLTYQRSLGYRADVSDQKVPSDSETAYGIGSISKVFTSTMVLQRVEQGKLSLDDTLEQFFPGLPKGDSITIRQLLNHSSGLHNFTADPVFQLYYTQPRSQAEFLKTFSTYQAEFSPGTQHKYSNTNYVLLSYILEKVTGEEYSELLDERIAQPLGLSRTQIGLTGSVEENRAFSFKLNDTTWQQHPETHPSIALGAGSVFSTPADLCRFAEGVFDGKMLSSKSLETMQTFEEGYGLGLFQYIYKGDTAIGHTGGIDGFQAMLVHFPEKKLTIAFCGNGVATGMTEIVNNLVAAKLGQPVNLPAFEPISLPVSQLEAFVGTFTADALPFDLVFTVEDGQLMLEPTGQGKVALKAYGDRLFRYDRVALVLEFGSVEVGKPAQTVELRQGGNFVFTRKE